MGEGWGGGGGVMKNQGIASKTRGGGGIGQFADLRGCLARKRGEGVFEGCLIPQFIKN